MIKIINQIETELKSIFNGAYGALEWEQLGNRNEKANPFKGELKLNDIYCTVVNGMAVFKMYMDTGNKHLCYLIVPNANLRLDYWFKLKQCTWVPTDENSLGIKTGKFGELKHYTLCEMLKDLGYNAGEQLLIVRDWKEKLDSIDKLDTLIVKTELTR